MGCNQSKKKDDSESRERVDDGSINNTKSSAQPIQGGTRFDNGDSAARSYTDERQNEKEVYERISKKAIQNLVSVTAVPDPLEEGPELEQRRKDYREALKTAPLSQGCVDDLFAVPYCSITEPNGPAVEGFIPSNTLIDLLNKPVQPRSEDPDKALDAVTSALSSFSISVTDAESAVAYVMITF
eukprot:TRINITY_DN2351_c0_g1_i1.p1 TRINITY_DN2351_c0_g1~~TRINITY_DN2351_c0_g1_i1.p1  ORF type:complete len:184 (-),score=15.59 TRINITY_DN2351_c0_g1_i1:55-606(-)